MTNNTHKDTEMQRDQIVLIEIVLGMDHYLIDSNIIEKFVPCPEAIMVHNAPPYVEGVAVIGDDEIPIINVTPLLGMGSAHTDVDDEKERIAMILPKGAIIESGIAVMVDKVQQLIKIEKDQIVKANIFGVSGIEDFVKGIIRLQIKERENEVLLYLHLEKMLTELLQGKVSRPSQGFYVWRWTQFAKDESNP